MSDFDTQYAWVLEMTGDPVIAFEVVREIAYYDEHGVLPDDATVLERVKVVNDTRIYIWRDPAAAL